MAVNLPSRILARGFLCRHRKNILNSRRLKSPFIAIQCLLARDYQSAGSAESVSVSYKHGMMIVSVPLPSRHELCEFTLRPVTHTVKDLIKFISDEDKGIDRTGVYNMEDVKISNSTPIEMLMKQDFKLIINDISYDVVPPKEDHLVEGHVEVGALGDGQISQLRQMVNQLYIELNIKQYQEQRENEIMKQLEHFNSELGSLEIAKEDLNKSANTRVNLMIWGGMAYMAIQFGFLARLTWWEYSWDIMEPVTYFITYGTSMAMYAYFVLTKQEYIYPDATNRQYLHTFHKQSSESKFDLIKYNTIKDAVSKLEEELKLLKSPQYKLPVAIEANDS